MNRKPLRERRNRSLRAGTATIELALCMPLLTILFLGTIDACHVIGKRQILSLASHQACRKAAEFNSTSRQVRFECARFLETQNLDGKYEIRTVPAEIAAATPGEPVTVEIVFDASRHCFIIDSARDTYEITASFTVLRRYPPLPAAGPILDLALPDKQATLRTW